jgi:hypothetical protein
VKAATPVAILPVNFRMTDLRLFNWLRLVLRSIRAAGPRGPATHDLGT